mgnify:CR=1 FL=1
MATNSSVIAGIHTGRSTVGIGNSPRGPEDSLIKKQEIIEMVENGNQVDLPLCRSFVLPEGKTCSSRGEMKRHYFCAVGKETCPLNL